MKRLKFILGLVAGTAVLSMMGCDLAVRNPYSNDTVGDVTEEGGSFTLETNVLSDYLTTVEEVEDAIDLSEVGGSGLATAIPNATAKWENPLLGKDLDGFTISFDVYPDTSGTYTGVLGLYDSTTGGFVWFTNTQWFLNSNANTDTTASDFSYIDTVSYSARNAEWQKIALTVNSSGYAVYNDGVKVRSGSELNGNLTTMDGLIGFVTDKADYLALGLGVSFWDNKALENTYVKNIKLYEKSLDDAALAELFGTEITEATTIDVLNVDVSNASDSDNYFSTANIYLNGVEILQDKKLPLGWWNHLENETLVQISAGDTVSFVMEKSIQGTDNFQGAELHLWLPDNSKGNALRCDNFLDQNLCSGDDPGIWVKGWSSANGKFYNEGGAESVAKAEVKKIVIYTVKFDGENCDISFYIDGTLVYKTNTAWW